MKMLIALLTFLLIFGCSEHGHDHDHDHASEHDHGADHEDGGGHSHHHVAPHGGALIELGDHFAHLECVKDEESGEVVLYVLDGGASQSIRLTNLKLEAEVRPAEGDPIPLTLEAQESSMTGETRGDSSEFRGLDERVSALKEFELVLLTSIEVKGREFTDVSIRYPEGGEAASQSKGS